MFTSNVYRMAQSTAFQFFSINHRLRKVHMRTNRISIEKRKKKIEKPAKNHVIYFISDMFEEKIQIADDTFILQRPKKYTYFNNYAFVFERKRQHSSYYHCADYRTFKCKTRLVLGPGASEANQEFKQFRTHNHSPRHNAKRNLTSFFCLFVVFSIQFAFSIFITNWFFIFIYSKRFGCSNFAQRTNVLQTLQ